MTQDRRRTLLGIAREFKSFNIDWSPILLVNDFSSLHSSVNDYEQIKNLEETSKLTLKARGYNQLLVDSIPLDSLIHEGETVIKSNWLFRKFKRKSFDKKLQALMHSDSPTANASIDLGLLKNYFATQKEVRERLSPISQLPQKFQTMAINNRVEFKKILDDVGRLRNALVGAQSSASVLEKTQNGSLGKFVTTCGRVLNKFEEAQGIRNSLSSSRENISLSAKLKETAFSQPAEMLKLSKQALEIRAKFAAAGFTKSKTGPISFKGGIANFHKLARRCLSLSKSAYENIANYKDIAKVSAISSNSPAFFKDLVDQTNSIIHQRQFIKSYVWLNELQGEAAKTGLINFAELALRERVSAKELIATFKTAYAKWLLPPLIDSSPALRNFQRVSHEDAIDQFRKLDEEARNLASQRTRLAVFHDLPANDQVGRRSELGILNHQANLKKPSKSIRSMIEEMPTTFIKLTPCMLMSPLSIAQYLPANHPQFDVVIFDEASQITTWDAIGAIARGRQTIIVGDPKQLPPTNFFGKANEDDEDVEDHERDLESILDEARSSGLPTIQLNWHYRSKHESLIAFSNWKYYGNQLVTFPAAESIDRGVEFHYVQSAIYGRGGSRTNVKEAEAIVQHLCDRMRECLAKDPKDRLTYGVVTFNTNQQSLIQDLLDAEFRKSPELEWFVEDDRIEPTMIKNLESVQGDERDVMYFSVTFGHTSSSTVSSSFGALNYSGGERRLNVAITRARQSLHVFSSVRAGEIPLGSSQSQGLQDLVAFLDYAERGPEAILASDALLTDDVYDSPFEESIVDSLRKRGWRVKTQVGVSGFRIDIGVLHPSKPDCYLAGIECDGATYHRSSVARDRDKIRQQILEGLGWSILRVWSTDWCYSPLSAIEALHAQLLTILGAPPYADVEDLYRQQEDLIQQAVIQSIASTSSDDPPIENCTITTMEELSNENGRSITNEVVETLSLDDAAPDEPSFASVSVSQQSSTACTTEPTSGSIKKSIISDASDTPSLEPLYAVGDRSGEALVKYPRSKIPDRSSHSTHFLEDDYTNELSDYCRDLVELLGPIREDLLRREIANAYGFRKVGNKIAERIQTQLRDMRVTEENNWKFYWPVAIHGDVIPYRRAEDGDVSRTIDEIPLAELAGFIREVNDSIKEEDRMAAIAKRLNINKLHKANRERLERAYALAHGGKSNTASSNTAF